MKKKILILPLPQCFTSTVLSFHPFVVISFMKIIGFYCISCYRYLLMGLTGQNVKGPPPDIWVPQLCNFTNFSNTFFLQLIVDKLNTYCAIIPFDVTGFWKVFRDVRFLLSRNEIKMNVPSNCRSHPVLTPSVWMYDGHSFIWMCWINVLSSLISSPFTNLKRQSQDLLQRCILLLIVKFSSITHLFN